MTDVIIAKQLKKYYQDYQHRLEILKGVDLQVKRGEMLAIMGSSGSGKSTLLHILGTLDKPSEGELWIDGVEAGSLNERQRSRLRNEKLGFVYQFHHLLPEFTALENVSLPLRLRGESKSLALDRAAEMLSRVGLAQRVGHQPSQLSGGERQRVALARALVTQPICLLADEPTGNLDSDTAERMYALLKEINEQVETAFLLVTHDPRLAQRADRCLYMDKGVLHTHQPSSLSAVN